MRGWLASAAVAGLVGLVAAAPAVAHPSDEVLQQLYVTPTSHGVTIDMELTPGVLTAAAFVSLVDTDGDGVVSLPESVAYAELVRRSVVVTINGEPASTSVGQSSFPDMGVLAAGGGTIGIELMAAGAVATSERLVGVTNSYIPTPASTGPLRTTVQAAVTLARDQPVVMGSIEHPDDGRTLLARYDQRSIASSTGGAPLAKAGTRAVPYLLGALKQPLDSPLALATLLGASALLGALHALTPGHGKTLLAAYLVGEHGTPGQAVARGGVVTLTHTASVIGIGVAVLVAGRYVVPGVVVPAVELGAGLVVTLLGARLMVRRWRGRRAGAGGHDHDHAHDGGHGHRDRAHGDDAHPPPSESHLPSKPASLLTMGVTGGIVPCPEALGVLVLAVGVHRTALGLAMIVAFSAGLALVLVGLGLILVTATLGQRLRRAGEHTGRLGRLIPLGSASVVVVLGMAMAVRGLASLAAR